VRKARLAHVPARVHGVAGEGDPEEAARAYDAELRAAGALDLALLGIGADGHTASLFPGSPALLERDRLAVAARAPAGTPGPWRVTLTFAALDAARRAAFLVQGAEKRSIVARVLAGDDLPAAKVRAAEVLLLVTRDAVT
jgi:6-phosphogluconolactonase